MANVVGYWTAISVLIAVSGLTASELVESGEAYVSG